MHLTGRSWRVYREKKGHISNIHDLYLIFKMRPQSLFSVFAKIYSCLKLSRIFINADQILGRTPEVEKAYEKAWLEQAKSNKCTKKEIEVALKRMESDKTLPLSNELCLLEKAGFSGINCWYQYYRYAVYSGIKSS